MQPGLEGEQLDVKEGVGGGLAAQARNRVSWSMSTGLEQGEIMGPNLSLGTFNGAV